MIKRIFNKIFQEHYDIAALPALLVSFSIWVIGFYKGGPSWVVLLFSVPLVVQLIGLWVLHKRLKADTERMFSKLIFYWYYLITMTLCLVFYCGLWLWYLRLNEHYQWESEGLWLNGYNLMGREEWTNWPNYISGAALGCVVVLLILVITMTGAIIKGGPSVMLGRPKELHWRDFLDCLRCGAAQEPFWTLLFFFTVFLSVSYLFGLAFAFHDKSYPPGRPALYMKSLPQPPVLFHANDLKNPATLAANLRTPKDRVSTYLKSKLLPDTQQLLRDYNLGTPSEDLQRALVEFLDREIRDDRLYDKELFPETELNNEMRQLAERHPTTGEELHRLNRYLLEKAYSDAIAMSRSGPFTFTFVKSRALLIIDGKPDQGTGKAAPANIQENKSALEKLVGEIRNATEESQRARIVVTGYADDANPKAVAYNSNYELAEARALNAKSTILSYLSSNGYDKWRNIEWEFLSESNERKEVTQAAEVYLERVSEEPASLLVPYLKAEHPSPLSLLDYVYFANYTITTTGYGDIIPSTRYAKFICSFANICEVFFLVVFFNALLSLRKGGGEALFPSHAGEQQADEDSERPADSDEES
jgi:flagellar motor protein MotB